MAPDIGIRQPDLSPPVSSLANLLVKHPDEPRGARPKLRV